MKRTRRETLQVAVSESGEYPCVRVAGEGDSGGAEELGRALKSLVHSGHTRIILDTRDLRFFDTSCYDTVVEALRQVEENDGVLVVVDSSPPVERTLKLLNIEELVHVSSSVGQAAAYLNWHE